MIKRKPKPCLICSKPVYKVGAKVCSVNCSLEYNLRNPDKVKNFVEELKKKREREQKRIEAREKKELEAKFKTLKATVKKKSDKDTLQTLINTIVRLIDYGSDCITSGAKFGAYTVNAGHYFSIGSNASLRYNLLNIFNQSQNDNTHKGGRGSNYGLRLKEVFGEDVRDEIEGLVAKYPYIGLSKVEIKEKCAIARQIIKELGTDRPTLTPEQRIEMRRKYNKILGIYN